IDSIKKYIDDIYMAALDSAYYFENVPQEAFVVPTKILILEAAWSTFDQLYLEYIKNGNDPAMALTVKEYEEEGLDDLDITEIFNDWRSYNASYDLYYSNDNVEIDLFRDVNKALSLFHLSY